MQVFFDVNQKHVFDRVAGVYFFVMLSELRFVKWVRFFERNCIVKWVIFFASFVDFETFNQKTWIRKVKSNMRFLIIYFLVQISDPNWECYKAFYSADMVLLSPQPLKSFLWPCCVSSCQVFVDSYVKKVKYESEWNNHIM